MDAFLRGEIYNPKLNYAYLYWIKNFENETEYTKFIRNCEKHVRGSLEYKQWRNYIIDVLGIHTCMITEERMDQCTIELHHHLPSLFTVVKSIINKKIEQEQEFSTFDIALETIELHFKNKIGYVTLIKSLHEKFHNGFLTIPIQLIRGDFKSFLSEYSEYMDDDDLEVIDQRLSITESNCSWSKDNYSIGGV